MNAQQLHDYIIKPTLKYMSGNYYSKDAAFLLLCTSAIESNCGDKIKQDDGPALGIFQMEPATHGDIWMNCDRLKHEKDGISSHFSHKIMQLLMPLESGIDESLIVSPMYACAMARLKYSMDKAPLPDRNDIKAVYGYYKRIYNTPSGASTYEKFLSALASNRIIDVEL
jgi:hypothetical protein